MSGPLSRRGEGKSSRDGPKALPWPLTLPSAQDGYEALPRPLTLPGEERGGSRGSYKNCRAGLRSPRLGGESSPFLGFAAPPC